jgi:hypothetical protein
MENMRALLDHVARQEAQLAAWRAALEFIAESHDAGRHDGLTEPCPAHDAETMWAVARDSILAASPLAQFYQRGANEPLPEPAE